MAQILNGFLAQGGGSLNNNFQKSNTGGLPRQGSDVEASN